MTTSTGLQNVLDEVLRAVHDVEFLLHKERVCSNGTTGDFSNGQPGVDFPPALEGPRKKLANAAAQLLQVTTDPKEYLEQLSANVSGH